MNDVPWAYRLSYFESNYVDNTPVVFALQNATSAICGRVLSAELSTFFYLTTNLTNYNAT